MGQYSNACHRGTKANAYFIVLFCTAVNVAALAANNPSDRDEFAAEAAPAKLKTSVLIADDLFALALVFFEAGIGLIDTVLEFRLGVFQAVGPAPCFQSLVVLLFAAR